MVDHDGNPVEARRPASEARERTVGERRAPAKRGSQPSKRPFRRLRWQAIARLGLALGLVGFAVVVWQRVQERTDPVHAPVIDRLDSDAVIESTGIKLVRTAGGDENFALTAPRQGTYEDGSTLFSGGVSLTVTEQTDRQSFIVNGAEARLDDTETNVTISGDVQLTVSDGLMVRTGRLVYAQGSSLVTMADRTAGVTTISRPGLEAAGRNPVFDRDRDVLDLPEAATVRLTGDDDRAAVTIESARATLAHADHYMNFEGGASVVTGSMVLESEKATLHFGEEDTALERLELRGRARISQTDSTSGELYELSASDMTLQFEETTRALTRATLSGAASISSTDPAPGGLREMRAREMAVTFDETTGAVERVTLVGKSTIELVGSGGGRGARIQAATMDVIMASDHGGVMTLEAWDDVVVQLPDTTDGVQQEIRAGRLSPDGPPGAEMSAVRFEPDVEYREERVATGTVAAVSRVVRADQLEAGVEEGLSALVEARFRGDVSFTDDMRSLDAEEVVYDVAAGLVTLRSVADAGLTPSLTDATSRIEANTITLAVDGSMLEASGGGTSVLTPGGARRDDTADSSSRKIPALLEEDEQVLVSFDTLAYDGETGRTTYSGQAHLWQADTSFEADTLAIDDETGDLTATGNVRTRLPLMRLNETTRRTEVSPTSVEAAMFVYHNAARHAVYTTTVVLRSEHGNMKSDTLEIFLESDDRTLDRLEATGTVTLGLANRWVTGGEHLVYYEADGRYEVEGAPVVMVEEVEPEETATAVPPRPGATPPAPSCSNTTGRRMTFFRSTDTMVVDGEVLRGQMSSGRCTPPTF